MVLVGEAELWLPHTRPTLTGRMSSRPAESRWDCPNNGVSGSTRRPAVGEEESLMTETLAGVIPVGGARKLKVFGGAESREPRNTVVIGGRRE